MMTDKRLDEIELLYMHSMVSSRGAMPEHQEAIDTIPELLDEIKRQALVIERLLFPEELKKEGRC